MSALGAFNPSLNVTEILRGALDEVLPPDAHVRCTDRLFVSITELPLLTNRIISKFHSRDHLIHVRCQKSTSVLCVCVHMHRSAFVLLMHVYAHEYIWGEKGDHISL